MDTIIAMQAAEMSSGQAVTLYAVQASTEAGTRAEPNAQAPGIRRFALADGRALTMVGHGEYKVEGTDEVFLIRDKDQAHTFAASALAPSTPR